MQGAPEQAGITTQSDLCAPIGLVFTYIGLTNIIIRNKTAVSSLKLYQQSDRLLSPIKGFLCDQPGHSPMQTLSQLPQTVPGNTGHSSFQPGLKLNCPFFTALMWSNLPNSFQGVKAVKRKG